LNEGWLFVLAIVGAYEGMTAMLNADLVYGVFYLVVAATSGARRKEAMDKITTAPPVTSYEQQGYQTVA
jgi:hypothetical protein